MKIHRFIGKFNLQGKEVAIDDPKIIRQIVKVLRLKNTDQIILGDGQGLETIGGITKIKADSILVTLGEKVQKKELGIPKISLYLAILKKENFEWVAQKVTEIGVSEIIPLHTERVVKQNINEERVKKIMKEAAEQSGRGLVPDLLPPLSLEEGLIRSKASAIRWFLDEQGKSVKTSKKQKSMSVFVGPEGGWIDEERIRAQKSGCDMVKISPFTLRAETAAITSVFFAQALTLQQF